MKSWFNPFFGKTNYCFLTLISSVKNFLVERKWFYGRTLMSTQQNETRPNIASSYLWMLGFEFTNTRSN